VNASATGALLRALAASTAVSIGLALYVAHVWLGQLAWAPPSARAFVQASALSGVGLVLRPTLPPGAASGITWTVVLAAIALLWLPSGSAAAALGVLLILGLATALHALALRCTRDPDSAARATLAVLGLAATAPLWAGPWAENASPIVADAIIGMSPLSLVAVLANHDYLREPWWYTHSVFGALRFDYPAVGPLVAAYLGVSALLFAAARASFHPMRSIRQ
jgi:hypothetical protein